MSPNTRGALLMMASMAAFTLNDTCIKATDKDLPLFQLLTLRGIISTILIYILARRLGSLRFDLSGSDWSLVALRSVSEIAAAYFFLTALLNMPLANITAVLQVLPLTVTLGAALFFGDPVGWRRMTAILVGFLGMLLIVRPGPDGFDIDAVYALAAVLSVTVRDLATRRMSAAVPSMTVTFIASSSVMVFFGIGSLGTEWQPLDLRLTLLLLGASFFILGGYLFSVMVMRVGDVSFIAPFRYSGLLWALALGWLVFGDWPANLTLLGAAIVVVTGVFTLFRERTVLREETVARRS